MLFGGKRNFYSKGTIMAERKSAGQIYRQYSKQIAAQGSALQQSVVETFGFEPTHAVSPPKLSPGEIAICARLDTIIDCMAQQTTTLEPAPLTEAPQQKREYGYWPDSLKRLLHILKNSGRAVDFMACAKSGANMLELLHEHGLATIAERDSKSTQRAVCKALEKYRDYVNAYVKKHQDDYRTDIEQLDDVAHGAGLIEARRKSGKSHDYTPKFKEPKK